MSRKTIEFTAFGGKYKTEQFSAVEGLEMIDHMADIPPEFMLRQTYSYSDGKWNCLSERSAINSFVIDAANAISPFEVLQTVMSSVANINFGFLKEWKCLKVPQRFVSGARTVDVTTADPLVTTLVQSEVATMRELEEYYSLEDAFKLFDIVMAKGINEALANEAAAAEAKQRR